MKSIEAPVVNIVVDIERGTLAPKEMSDGTTIGLTPQAQSNYLKSVRQAVDELAAEGIPTIWIRFPERTDPPLSKSERDDEKEIDKALGREEGPNVFFKTGFSGFATGKNLDGVSLQDYLKNATHITIMGGNADVCDLATAIDGAKDGERQVTILSDLIIGRNNPTGDTAKCREDIQETLTKILKAPHLLEGHPLGQDFAAGTLSESQKANVKENLDVRPYGDVLPSLIASPDRPANRPGIANSSFVLQ